MTGNDKIEWGSKKRDRKELNEACQDCVEFNYGDCYGASKTEFYYPNECPMYQSMNSEDEDDE